MERKPEEKKGLFTKLKENIENYVELPMVKKSNTSADITFVASVFTGALATFGLTTGNGKNKEKEKPKT